MLSLICREQVCKVQSPLHQGLWTLQSRGLIHHRVKGPFGPAKFSRLLASLQQVGIACTFTVGCMCRHGLTFAQASPAATRLKDHMIAHFERT